MDMLNLRDVLKGKVVIVCIGNIERGDDGIGPHIAPLLKDSARYEVIDAGVSPENYTGVIKRLNPDTVIIIDAVYFEARVGEIRLFKGDDLYSGRLSTHDMSPRLLIEYLKSSTDADIYLLGIRPGLNRFGRNLSEEVEKTKKKIELLFPDLQIKCN